MLITDSKLLREIKEEFHQKFKFLKLEFYEGSHKTGQA